jgi:CubicO group peptidase (beta-lactamase class C family)
VDLDAPVQTYLPWFRVADEAASAQITVRMLLNHTSGIPGSAGMEYFASDADLETQVRALANVELDRPVGESYEYANPTYATLALIVQETSGESFEAYLQDHIFNPLEMSNSFASKEKAAKDGLATGHTFALTRPIGLDVPYNRGGVPYCCIISSAEDLSHFLIMQMNGGQYKSRAVLSPKGIEMMHAPAVQEDRPERYYGMAWETRPVNGVATVMHTGEGIGWQANLIMLEDGWGIVVLENGYDFVDSNFGADRIRGIALGVTSMVVGQQPPQAESGSGTIVFYGVLAAIWLIQFFGMVRTVRLIKHGKNARKFTGVYLPLLVNLLWGGVMIFVVPNVLMPFSLMKLLAPVLAYTLLASGITAFVWAFARTILVRRSVRKTM